MPCSHEILNETQDIELPNNNNVYNILLIGVDRRDKNRGMETPIP